MKELEKRNERIRQFLVEQASQALEDEAQLILSATGGVSGTINSLTQCPNNNQCSNSVSCDSSNNTGCGNAKMQCAGSDNDRCYTLELQAPNKQCTNVQLSGCK